MMATEPMPMDVNVYRHYKGGLYRVLFGAEFAFSTTNTNPEVLHDSKRVMAKQLDREPCVVYVSMTNGRVFVRPYTEFYGDVTIDGLANERSYQRPRFEQVVDTGKNETNG